MKNGAVRLNHEKHLEGRNFYSVFVPFSAERFFKQKKNPDVSTDCQNRIKMGIVAWESK
jgi:hypothetical protein